MMAARMLHHRSPIFGDLRGVSACGQARGSTCRMGWTPGRRLGGAA